MIKRNTTTTLVTGTSSTSSKSTDITGNLGIRKTAPDNINAQRQAQRRRTTPADERKPAARSTTTTSHLYRLAQQRHNQPVTLDTNAPVHIDFYNSLRSIDDAFVTGKALDDLDHYMDDNPPIFFQAVPLENTQSPFEQPNGSEPGAPSARKPSNAGVIPRGQLKTKKVDPITGEQSNADNAITRRTFRSRKKASLL